VNPSTTAAEFERHRGHLTAVAYRMLGTLADAEDAVQEAYLRFARTDIGALRDVRAWLTTTVARIRLDHLGSARARARELRGPVAAGAGGRNGGQFRRAPWS
jgi:RNA polymerase sigma-70 factor, ECF subfamily